MSKPIIAIVGRPNVGKSMLFNKIIGRRLSIVEDPPGVTRDRIYGESDWQGRKFTLIDTGGIEPRTDNQILAFMRSQAQIAIDNATVIVFLCDIKTGMTASDQEVASMLQRCGKPVILAVNKVDQGRSPDIYEFYNLGLGDPIAVSAVHGHGTGDLLDACVQYFPPEDEEEEEDDAIKVAVIGKPNAGKSSLVNKILGEERVIVSNVAGTTRDAIDSRFTNDKGSFVFIDTAGMRKKSKIEEDIEKYSVLRATMAIDRADVCLIMIDATEGVTEQDTKVAGMAHEAGKASIIVVNKWDLVEKDDKTMARMTEEIRRDLAYMTYAPILQDRPAGGQAVRHDRLCGQSGRFPGHYRYAEYRSGGRPDPRPASHGQGPSPEDLLYDAGGYPPTSLCDLLQRRAAVPLLLSAVSGKLHPLHLPSGGHPHHPVHPGKGR